MSTAAEPTPRPARRVRSTSESLLSIVLALEAMLVFFVSLTVFGLRVLPALIALGGGTLLIVILLMAGRALRYPWGIWVGWVLQAVLIATGMLLPVMYVVGAVFVAIWVYCFVRGRQIDRQRGLA